MTTVKTSLVAVAFLAAGSASAFACAGKVNASAQDQIPAPSHTQASLQLPAEMTTVARADLATKTKASVVTE